MAHTQTPWKIKRTNGARNLVHIVSATPLFEGGLLIRIATMNRVKSFAGDALANAELLCAAVNAWDDADALQARVAELRLRNVKP